MEDCDSPEICPQTIFRDRLFDPDDGVKWKELKLGTCGKFYVNYSGLQIRPKRGTYTMWRHVLLKKNI